MSDVSFRRLHVSLMTLAAICIAITLAFSVVWILVSAKEQDDENHHALVALCAFRDDLSVRIKATERWLELNPEGVAGLSAETIRVTLTGERRTLAVLDGELKDCS